MQKSNHGMQESRDTFSLVPPSLLEIMNMHNLAYFGKQSPLCRDKLINYFSRITFWLFWNASDED